MNADRGSSGVSRVLSVMALTITLACVLAACSSNRLNELGVYTLCAYENSWKGNVCLDDAHDPYVDFWASMNCGTSSECAHESSRRRLNPEVNLHTILPIPGDGWKSWDQFDLVFFYGHNNTLVPPHPHDTFHYSNYEAGAWVSRSGYLDDIGWGQTTNFDYYALRPIDYADHLPAALTYLYNEYTSSLLLCQALLLAPAKADQGTGEKLLDLRRVRIESAAARKFLGQDHLRIRRGQTDYMPLGKMRLAQLAPMGDEASKKELSRLVVRFTDHVPSSKDFRRSGNIFVFTSDLASFWISRGSGSYKYTRTRASMARPSQLRDFRAAAQTALGQVARYQMVEPGEGEEVDLLFISEVRNAVATVEQNGVSETPEQEFVSDYYVGFGRRFQGIPIIGSRLVVRLDGEGRVASVQKNWRRIEQVSGQQVQVSARPLTEIIATQPSFHDKYTVDSIKVRDIEVLARRCGYVEAPVNYTQSALRPGCRLTFRIGGRKEETYPEITVALEDGLDDGALLGTKARDLSSGMDYQTITDRDDRGDDEHR